MIHHLALGSDSAERSRNIIRLIRKGRISLGGYKKAKIYGLLNCSSGKKIKTENRVFFTDETEALACGYRPCGHCLTEKYNLWKNSKKQIEQASEAFG